MPVEQWRKEYEEYVLQGNIEAAKKCVLHNAGGLHLFKFYRGTKQQLDTVMDEKFWLSNARYFNDPYDSLSLVNVRTEIKYDSSDPEARRKAYEEYKGQVESDNIAYDFQGNVYATCFSEIAPDNLHMWSYYADDHKGFCIEYLLKDLLEADINIMPVVYIDEWIADRGIEDYNTQVALIKGTEWQYEKEWRIVHIDSGNKNGVQIKGIAPEAIYAGCRDSLHIDDSWSFYGDLERAFGDSARVSNYVWKNSSTKICSNEILDRCERYTKKKIPLYSMKTANDRIGLAKRKVVYSWNPR